MRRSTSPRRVVAFKTGLVGILMAGLAVGGFAGVAHADGPSTVVTNESTLDSALTAGDQNIELGNDVTVSASLLTISYGLTLNLAGHKLTTQNITVGANSSLSVIDEDSLGNVITTGALSADGSSSSDAGITVGNSSYGLTVDDITLTATGGLYSAGIGGDYLSDRYSGSIEIDNSTLIATGGDDAAAVGSARGGEVEASIRITNTAVIATAGGNAAVIGSGSGPSNDIFGNVDLDVFSPGKSVILNGNSEAPVIGPSQGSGYNSPGEWKLEGDIHVDSPGYIDVPGDSGDYTISGNLSGTGKITGVGTLVSYANIPWQGDQLSSDVTIEGYNYPVNFNAQGGTPQSQNVTVHGSTFAGGGVTAPSTNPVIEGGIFKDWEQSGQPFSDTDNITNVSEYDAVYNPITSLALGTTSGSSNAGETETFQSIGSDAESDTSDQSQWVVITSSNSSDQINGDSVTFGKADSNPRTLTFTLPLDISNPPSYTEQISTNPTAAASLTLAPSASSVLVGASLTFAVNEQDAGGDLLGAPTDAPILTSSIGADTISGNSVTFHSAGLHVITAKADGLSGTYSVEVTPTAAPKKLAFQVQGLTPTAGAAFPVSVTGLDSSGDYTGDYTSRVVWSGLNKTDVVGDHAITFDVAGTRTLKATVGKVSTTIKLTVAPASLDHIAFVKPATSVVSGSTTTFTVDGYDVYGNSLGVDNDATIGVTSAASGEGALGNHVTLITLGARTVHALDASAANSAGNYVTAAVTVVAGSLSQLVPGALSSEVAAGSIVTFSVAGEDSESNPLGDVTTKTRITSSVSSDKIAANKVTVTAAGEHTLKFTDGKVSATYALTVDAAVVVPGKYRWDDPVKSTYIGIPQDILLDTADAYGNAVGSAQGPVTYAVTGTGATIDQVNGAITATTVGKRTITATVDGSTFSETVSFTTAPLAFSIPTTAITASLASSLTVGVGTGQDSSLPGGTAVLHYGTAVTAGVPISGTSGNLTATFNLPALKLGKYSFWVTYPGSGDYAATTSAKVSIIADAGPVTTLKFIKPPTSVVAGKATRFTVYGYDANNNFSRDETTAVDLGFSGAGGGFGSPITFTSAGSTSVYADLDGADVVTISLTVTPAALAQINPTSSDNLIAGEPLTVTATGQDAYGNNLGTVTSHLSVKSSVKTDKISKNKVTATGTTGDRTLTIKDGSVSTTQLVEVSSAAAVAGKYGFATPATTGYLNTTFLLYLGVGSEDKYGNFVQPAQDVTYLSNPTSYVINSRDETVQFLAVGKQTITATTGDGVTIKEIVNVVLDTPSRITFDHGALLPDTPTTIVTQIDAGRSGELPTGTATLHYGTQTITEPLDSENAEAPFDLPGLTGTSYVMYVTYNGDGIYAASSSPKYTVLTNGIN